MKSRRTVGAAAVVTALGLVGVATAAAPASAGNGGSPGPRVVTSGLSDPFGLQAVGDRGFIVAESGSGEVTRVYWNGRQRVVLKDVAGVSGVAAGYGKVFAVLGGGDETGAAPPAKYPPTSVIRTDYRGRNARVIANLKRYELRHNPDRQVQTVNGRPVQDVLSNPFSMNLSKYGLLVADGGGNDVLKVNRHTGRVSTYFVPPNVTDVPACLAEGAQANPGSVGCDSVPTGIAVAKGSVYVSTLGGGVPGAGRVYRLEGRTGRIQKVYKGLTGPTGIAVTPWGTIYVSQVDHGAPAGPPPAGFDPAGVGRITKISNGRMTHAPVTMPTGLDFHKGRLYASTWSIASFLGLERKGQIVKVDLRAFR